MQERNGKKKYKNIACQHRRVINDISSVSVTRRLSCIYEKEKERARRKIC